jgi:hypothetical protein
MRFGKRKAARDRRPDGLADVVPTREVSVPFPASQYSRQLVTGKLTTGECLSSEFHAASSI